MTEKCATLKFVFGCGIVLENPSFISAYHSLQKVGLTFYTIQGSRENNSWLSFCSSDKFFRTSFTQIFLLCKFSLWFGGRTFSAVLSPLPLTAPSNLCPYPEQSSHEPHCSQFLKLKDAVGAVSPQRTPFCSWKPCDTWRLGLKTKQNPNKLSSTTATFRNQIFRVSRRSWSRNAAPNTSAFSPIYKTQKLLRTLLKYRLIQRGGLNLGRSNCMPGFHLHLPRPPLSFPGPSALQKNCSNYFWDRLSRCALRATRV